MKKNVLSFALIVCILVVLVTGVSLAACTGKKSNNPNEISTSPQNVISTSCRIEYLDNNLAWNIFTEAKYKLNTSYENCLNNFQIEKTNYWQEGTRKSSSTMQYLMVNHEYGPYYIIRDTRLYDTNNKTDFLYYNKNKKLNLMSETIDNVENYNTLYYNKQMTCLTNEDICLENLLLCEIDKDGNYILKFSKTFDSAVDYDDYVAYYEVEISSDKLFSKYRNCVETNTSSGYIDYTETYSYNVVNSEELLSLIPN